MRSIFSFSRFSRSGIRAVAGWERKQMRCLTVIFTDLKFNLALFRLFSFFFSHFGEFEANETRSSVEI